MKTITRVISALAFAGTILAASTAFAATPFEIASKAYRGELEGIRGYQGLSLDLSSGKTSVEDIITAAGKEATPELERSVGSFLRNFDNND